VIHDQKTPADVDSKAHVLVTNMGEATLSDVHHHHLGRVLRLRSGDCITVTDGKGSWRIATLGSGWPTRADLEWTSETLLVPRRLEPVAVGFALTKGDKPEIVVQKLAELGVDRIVPFTAAHSVAQWDPEKAARNVARLRLIAAEALQQSRQAWLSEVAEHTSFTRLASLGGHSPASATDTKAAARHARTDLDDLDELHDRNGLEGLDVGLPARADRGGVALRSSTARFVLIGPEGGWSAAERELLPESVGIAPAVLRAETAAIVAGALLVQRSVN
jgi:16S rRNA (uracil1498-N3)-methyltransferase